MPSFFISHADGLAWEELPVIPGVSSRGTIRTRAAVRAPERPLTLWLHQLSPGAELCWTTPAVAHAVYVWQGSLEAGDRTIPEEGALVVEHRGTARVRAGSAGATIAHFHRPDGHPEQPARAGGHAHLYDREGIFHADRLATSGPCITLFADAGCPTCDVWLHRSVSAPGRELATHCHSEDEIIFISKGTMKVGRDALGPGTALAIDKDTAYKFAAGDDGLSFVNYRSTEPFYIPVTPQGRGEPRNERIELRRLGEPGVNAPRQ